MEKIDLKGRSFLKLLDFTPEEILYLIDFSAELKEKKLDMFTTVFIGNSESEIVQGRLITKRGYSI